MVFRNPITSPISARESAALSPEQDKIAPWRSSLSQRCNDTVTTASHERATVRAQRRKEREVSMRILIVTDAWSPQVNGVVTTVRNTVRELGLLHHDVGLITPDGFRTLPCPTYPEIRLAIAPGPRVCRMIEEFEPDAVHIETEAPLGMAHVAIALHQVTRLLPRITRSSPNLSMRDAGFLSASPIARCAGSMTRPAR